MPFNYLKQTIKIIRQFYHDLSITYKMFLVFMAVALVPAAFYQYYSYTFTKTQLTMQANQNMLSSVNQIASNINKRLDSYATISNTIYTDADLMSELTQLYTSPSSYVDVYDFINKYMSKLLVMDSSLYSITIYSTNPSIPADDFYIKHMDNMSYQVKYPEIKSANGNLSFSPAYEVTAAQPLYVFSISRLLNYFDYANPYGVLSISVKVNEFYSMIEKELEFSNKSIFITNEEGNIITSGDMKQVAVNISSILDISKISSGKSGTFDTDYAGKHSLVVYSSLKNGWTVISLVPYDLLLKDVIKSTQKQLIFLSIALLVSMILIYFTATLFSKRIKYLSKQIKKVENKEFNINVKDMGNDEIGQLIKSFKSMAQEINRLINDVYQKEILKRSAEMDALQAQINPHFLYNTLNSISSMALEQNDLKMDGLVKSLARFYRISLNKGKSIISVREELELIQNYTHILNVRFDHIFHFTCQIDQSILDFRIPKLILQPFIENCINHAVYDDEKGLNILIKALQENNSVVFLIIDDGVGATSEQLSGLSRSALSTGSSYGIKNVNDRIKLLYGEQYGVTIFSKLGIGTSVTITLPVVK